MENATVQETRIPWSLTGIEEDIEADLQAFGLTINRLDDENAELAGESLDQARRDALASMLLRREAEERAALAQAEASRDAEVAFIERRYAAEIWTRRCRAAALNESVAVLAQQTKDAGGYPPKKKSRDVGAGSYGFRSHSESVELQDEQAFIAWAEQHAPELLRVKVTMKLDEAKQYLTETELASTKREIVKAEAKKRADASAEPVPGYARTAAHDTFYATPLPVAAIHGARV